MDPKIYQIEKLNGSNYFLWRLKVEMILQREKVWCVVEDATPTSITEEWRVKDQSARATIGLTLEDKILVTIANVKTAKQVWTQLQSMYEHKGLASRLYLLKRLYSARYTSHMGMEEYLNGIMETVERLRAIKENVPENHLIAIILCGLPENYNPIVTAFETREEENLKLEYVMERLRDEAMRLEKSSETIDQNLAMSGIQPSVRRNVTCFLCGQNGHIKRNCPNYADYIPRITNARQGYNGEDRRRTNYTTSQTQPTFNTYYSTTDEDPRDGNMQTCESRGTNATDGWALSGCEENSLRDQNDWIIDSGASCHMSHIRDNFCSLKDLGTPINIKIANGDILKATGQGVIKLSIYNDGKNMNRLELKNVFYVPELDYQLLSVPSLCQDNYVVHFNKTMCSIYLNNKICAKGMKRNKTYVISGLVKEEESAMSAQPCIHVWHQRMGHKSLEGIRQLAKGNRVRDLKIAGCRHNDFCESCKLGSMRQMHFASATKKTTRPFKKLVSDVCGPIVPSTMGGKNYVLTITDDYSNYTHISLLQRKSDAAEQVIQFIKEGHNQFGYFPEIFRSDEGGEYMGNTLNSYFKNHGIHHQTAVVYTPQQNGRSERKNQTLLNMTRSMLKASGLPDALWGEAINTAGYILNRVQHSGQEKTPYEDWHGTIPTVKHLRGFGSTAYAFVPKQLRKKLEDTSVRGVMVGYGSDKKCFRIWTPGTKRIINAINVSFRESIEPGDLKRDYIPSPTYNNCVDIDFGEPIEDTPTSGRVPVRISPRNNKGVPAPRLSY